MNKWNDRFLGLAKHISAWSKDPSTKCGAVIVRDKRIISLGFNGFPQGVSDKKEWLDDRDIKYSMVLHAEVNALLFANRDLSGCTIYVWPMPPCTRCAAQIIQSGIIKVVSVEPGEALKERWGDSIKTTELMFKEADVRLEYIGRPT